MLINVTHDRAFQKFLDHWEQRLHVEMVPVLYRGIRIQLRDGGVNAHDFVVQRGNKILVAHYKRIFRRVYSSVEPNYRRAGIDLHNLNPDGSDFHIMHEIEKADSRGITAFMDRMLSYLESEGATRIQHISQSLMDGIRDAIMAGVEAGRSNTQIERDILEEAPDMSRNRAATIARTETHGAATWAMDETIDEKEIEVATKTWWTAGDSRVRDSHSAVHGTTIGRDELFELEGGSMGYPGDDTQGADVSEIVNCRCSCLYNTGGGE